MLGACGVALLLIACNAPTGQTTTSGGVTFAVTPDHARQGETITLSGQSWRPHSKITLAFSLTSQLGDRSTGLGTTAADEQGRFTFVTIVPQAATPGTWSIIVQGDVDQSASAFFVVQTGDVTEIVARPTATPAATDTPLPTQTPQPTDTLQPPATATATATHIPTNTPKPTAPVNKPTAAPTLKAPTLQATWHGNRLDLRGDGWPARERVKLSVSREKDGDNAIQVGVLGVNDKGQFNTTIKVPRQVRENWYVIASDGSQRVIARIAKDDGD